MKKSIGLVLWFSAFSAVGAPASGKYKDVVDRLLDLQKRFASVSHVFSIGQNEDGVAIAAVRISLSPTIMDRNKIGHILVSTHHGNEPDTPEFTLAFTEDLMKRYAAGPSPQDKLAGTEYYVIPVLNVSGYNSGKRHEYGIDPNRHYPGPCNAKPTPPLRSVDNLMQLLATRLFSGSVTIHGYLTSLTYPWGMYADDYATKDAATYDSLVREAALHNGYPAGNGALVLYPANGCYEDYVYWKHGAWSMLVEIDSGTSADIARTIPAVASFFDRIDRSPSGKNQFAANCVAPTRRDHRLE